jgi:type I restriction enzyme S subunit
MLHKSDYTAAGVPVVNPANIVNGAICTDKIMYISSAKAQELSKYLLLSGDILLARRGDLSKCAIITNNNVGWLCGTGSFVMHLCLVESSYFQYIYATQYIQSLLNTASVGATMDNLNQDAFSNILIPIPPQNEQQRIIKEIRHWFDLIDSINNSKQELIEVIGATKSKILDLAIHGKLVPQDPNDEPASELLKRIAPHTTPCDTSHYENFPETWCVAHMSEVYNHTTGKALKKADMTGELRQYITTSNVYWNSFDFTEVRSMYFTEKELDKCTAHKGDLLVCNGGDVGRAAIWDYDYDICYQNHISRLRPISVDIVFNPFYSYLFRYLKDKGQLNGKGVAITSLSAADIQSLAIPVPPLSEQKRIVERIETIFAQFDTITAEL